MPNCQAETIAVGGMGRGWAEDDSWSAMAMATASKAACSFESVWVGALSPAEFEAAVSSTDSFSAVSAARMTIISHSKIIAPNTSPMPRAVIWRERRRLVVIGFVGSSEK